MYSKLQQHTIDIYNLKEKEYQIEEISARDLLTPQRFDLFAKLFYIRNREQNKEQALRVYIEHIKAFNPDFCEPGRDDKVSLDDFISVFNNLIMHFKGHDFDPEKSLIPVSEDGVILDGAHRVAALAFWGKKVTVVKFNGVSPKGTFDYNYFKYRGLTSSTADLIASEILNWKTGLYVACLWPRMGKSLEKEKAVKVIEAFAHPYFIKKVSISLPTLVKLIANVYGHQDWVGDENNGFLGAKDKARRCYATNRTVWFVFFPADDLNKVLEIKEQIRNLFIYEKDSIHITDNDEETKQLVQLVLSEGEENILVSSKSCLMLLQDSLNEFLFYFKNILWLNFKVKVASLLQKIGLRK